MKKHLELKYADKTACAPITQKDKGYQTHDYVRDTEDNRVSLSEVLFE